MCAVKTDGGLILGRLTPSYRGIRQQERGLAATRPREAPHDNTVSHKRDQVGALLFVQQVDGSLMPLVSIPHFKCDMTKLLKIRLIAANELQHCSVFVLGASGDDQLRHSQLPVCVLNDVDALL